MIIFVKNKDGVVVRARCSHCLHCLRDRSIGYFGMCSTRKDEYGANIVEKHVNVKSYACDHFAPYPCWELFDTYNQLSLF